MGEGIMNDEFLYQARPELRSGFADELYTKISENRRVIPRLRHSAVLNQKGVRMGAVILIGLIFFVACARQLLEPRNIQVGTMWVQEGSTKQVVRMQFLEQNGEALSLPPNAIPINDALEMLPYKMKVPEWYPEGFSLSQDTVRPPIYPLWVITLTWSNRQNDQIVLHAFGVSEGEIRVPRGMWEEVRVNGLPAILIRGDFTYNELPPPDTLERGEEVELTWDKNAGIQLIWNQGGARFILQALGNFLDENELLRMAESMRTW